MVGVLDRSKKFNKFFNSPIDRSTDLPITKDKLKNLPVFRSASLPVKIVVGHQYLVFSKKNAGKLI